jgi:post-segregation antitoxin (ccd killing protein)
MTDDDRLILQRTVPVTEHAERLCAVSDKRAEFWRKENSAAIESYNTYVEQHGLPLEQYRMF